MENKNTANPRPTNPDNGNEPITPPSQTTAQPDPVSAYNSAVFEPQPITSPAAPINPTIEPAPVIISSPLDVQPQNVGPVSPDTAPNPVELPPQPITSPTAPINPTIEPAPVINSSPLDVQPQSFGTEVPIKPKEITPSIVKGSFNPPPNSAQYPINNSPATATPTTSNYPAIDSTATTPKDRKRAFMFFGLSVFVVICISIFVFAFYIPNLPNNVWATGLTRTAKQTDILIKKVQDPEAYKSLEKSSIVLKGKASTDGASYDVILDSQYDSTKSNSILDVRGKGEGTPYKINAQVKTVLPDSATLPNIYFKISGLSSLGLDDLSANIKKYDNTWVAVEQDYYSSLLEPGKPAEKQDNKNVTQQDVTSVLSDLNSVAKEYVFTNDPEKAVIEKVSFVGTEQSEGIKANHYKAKINKTHAVAYCKATTEKIFNNKSFRRIAGTDESNYAQIKKESLKSCESSAKDTDLGKPFDMWIDSKYKIIHKVRVYTDFNKTNKKLEEEKASCIKDSESYGGGGQNDCKYYDSSIQKGVQYTEFGQVFKGNSQIKLFLHNSGDVNGSKSDSRLDLSVDTDKLELSGKFTYLAQPKDGKDSRADISIISKPYEGKVGADKPAATVPIQQVLNDLGFNQ